MAAKNDVTGDLIRSKTGDQTKYETGWEKIFGNKIQSNQNDGTECEHKNDEGVEKPVVSD